MQRAQWVATSLQNATQRFSMYVRNYNAETDVFTTDDIAEFMTLTYLKEDEILRAYDHFCSMGPQFFNGEKNPYLPRAKVKNMPEFKVNPFKERMINVFSTFEDYMTFEDYLEMMSVFSENAPIELKAEYAFRIYDFDFDDMLSVEDLIKVIKHLKGDREMEEEEMQEAAVRALIDGDLDGDGFLAFTEFVHVITRMNDFKSSFTLRV